MEIQPITIWNNGTTQTATDFNLQCVWDNLSNEAKFYFQLLSASAVVLSEGNLDMSGTDYQNWNANPDINLAAYQWGAQQLNLMLV